MKNTSTTGVTSATRRTGAGVLLFLAVCMIAANMRATISGIGPLLDAIGDELGYGATALGVLAAVPLMAWAAVSPLAHGLTQRFGLSKVVLWSLLLLGVGTIWRSVPGPSFSLWAGTALIGVSLAIANVVMPAVIKRDFGGRVPLVTAVYSSLLGGIGAVGSAVVVPLSRIDTGGGEWGWRPALVATGILLPFAVVLWIATMRRSGREIVPVRPAGRQRATGIWGDALAWQVAGYMGLQAATFYMLVTWLAPMSTSIGRSPIVAGIDVAVYQICAASGALLLPVILRGPITRWIAALLPALAIIATLGLMIAPGAVLVWVILAGISSGASLSMSLTLMAQRARDSGTATALSGMAQSVGYVIAAAGPIAFGSLHTFSDGWLLPLLLLLAVLIAQGIVGLFVGRERFVLER